jgi:hypothetical protein
MIFDKATEGILVIVGEKKIEKNHEQGIYLIIAECQISIQCSEFACMNSGLPY